MMKAIFALALLIAVVAAQPSMEYGHCKLQGTMFDSGITGDVYFLPGSTPGTVMVVANVTGITQNLGSMHGMHVHEFGDLTTLNATSPGGHYKGPGNGTHGCPGEDYRDEGDMGNWMVDANGMLNAAVELNLLMLSGGYSIIGRAVVLHNKTDDCVTVPSSGARLAYCVIGVANPASFPAWLGSNNFTNNASSAGALASGGVNYNRAVCVLQSLGVDGLTGVVQFTQDATGTVTMAAVVAGLNYTVHAIHVHTYGDLTSTDGIRTGGHYNPNGAPHALPPTTPRHIGDTGNICTYDMMGLAWYQATPGLISINDTMANIIGRAVIIHSGIDTGGSTYGTRIAQCVIGWANAATTPSITGAPANVGAPECQAPIVPAAPTTTTTGSAVTSTTTATSAASSTTTTTTGGATTSASTAAVTTSAAASAAAGGVVALVFAAIFAVML